MSNRLKNDLVWGLQPSRWVKDNFRIDLDPWQRDLMDGNHSRVLLNASRQSGKSTTCSLLADWTAIYRAGSLSLIFSPSQRQSSELFRKCIDFLTELEQKPKIEEENKTQLQLVTGSRIVSVPGSEATFRGYSAPDLILIDESARVDDAAYEAARPMLAASPHGKLIGLSTPYGRRGWWFNAWTNGGPGWHRIEIPWDKCPRISGEFIEQERTTLPESVFRQEYECSFEDEAGRLFPSKYIDGMFSDEAATLDLPNYGAMA